MDSILARISSETSGSKQSFGSIFESIIKEIVASYKAESEQEVDRRIKNISVIRYRISQMKTDFENQLMILADGNVGEANNLRRSSVSQFLSKMDNYVTSIERLNKK